MNNWIPPTPEQIKEGLECQIIDMRASQERFEDAEEIKRVFKREIEPQFIFKSHILTQRDVEYYTENKHLIKRDLRILADL